MPANQVETKVKITGDTTGLDKLGRAAKKALDPKTAEKFGEAAQDINKELINLTKTQINLSKKIKEVEKGTKKYTDLKKEIKETSAEAKQLESILSGINRQTKPQEVAEQRAARARASRERVEQRATQRAEQRAARRQGFGAGLAQGVGVAQYIPTGPGMGARMGGAALGGMARRAVGGMAAPFVSPGVGGFAGLLGAIPGVGGAASAALMAGHGYFQQAIAFDRARIENLPYAQLQRRRVYQRGRLATGGRDIRAETTLAPSIVRQMEAEERVKSGLAGVGRIYGQQAVTEGGDTIRDLRRQLAQTTSPAMRRMLQADIREKEARVNLKKLYPEAAAAPEGREEKRVRAIIKQSGALRQKGRWVTRTISDLPGAGAGAQFGFAPTAVQGMFGEYMGARGGVARVQNEFRDVMVARRLFGVGAGLAGGYGRMMQPGAGGAGPGIARTIATALATGLRGSLITEHLQTLVQQGRQMEQEGVRFDISNLTGSAATLRALGMQGMQPTRVMGQMQAAARGVSARGVSGPMDLLMARAAGYRPEGGAESYAAAMNMLAGGLSPEMMTGLLGQITQGARGGEWGPQMQRMLVRRAMGQMGVRVGPEQAGMLLQGFQGGQLTGEAQRVLADIQQRSGRMGAEGFARQARLGAGIVGGKAVYAAGAEAQQIATGNKLAGMYMNLERVGRRSVSALSGFSSQLETASNIVLEAFNKINEYAQRIGSGAAVVGKVTEAVRNR